MINLKNFPIEIEKIILDYKFSIENHQKFSNVLDELKNNVFFCSNCKNNKLYNITPIVYNCLKCDNPICLNCVDETVSQTCIHCVILDDLINCIQKILGRNLTYQEIIIIQPYFNMSFKHLLQLNIIIHQLLEQFTRTTEILIDKLSFKNLFLRLKQIKNDLINNDQILLYIEPGNFDISFEIDLDDNYEDNNDFLNNTF